MVASYHKAPFCYTCDKRIDGFLKQHEALGHKTTEVTFGGYQKVEERREPIEPPKKEEKIKLNLCDMEEQGFFPDIEEGGQR